MVYSMDFRQAVARAYDDGASSIEVAEQFGCSESWVRRLVLHRRERGTLEPRSAARKEDQRSYDDADEAAIRELIKARSALCPNDNARDATYLIHSSERGGELTKICCGAITFVRGYAGSTVTASFHIRCTSCGRSEANGCSALARQGTANSGTELPNCAVDCAGSARSVGLSTGAALRRARFRISMLLSTSAGRTI
jgi:transposase